jgi:hypothetical protein
MTNERINSIVSEALRARDYLKQPRKVTIQRKRLKPEWANRPASEFPASKWERAQCWEETGELVEYTHPAKGSIRRNLLPLVTLGEHQWLVDNVPAVARYTRCFDYEDDVYIEDADLMTIARKSTVKEIWVGARSMACVGETELPEGHQFSQRDQEDASELTDLLTLTYQDGMGFDRWYIRTISNACRAAGKRANDFKWRRHFAAVIEDQFMRDRYGSPIKCMLTDDKTGEYRPVRDGDLITTAHGSNEDLDALFMDEADDPRCESDAIIRELTRDRVNPASDLEHQLCTFKERVVHPSIDGTPNGHTESEMVLPSEANDLYENELHLRQVAANRADEAVAEYPELAEDHLAIRTAVYHKLKARHGALRMDHEGTIVRGGWNGPKDIFGRQEEYIRKLERHLERHRVSKAVPAPMEWDGIRTPQQQLTRAELIAYL